LIPYGTLVYQNYSKDRTEKKRSFSGIRKNFPKVRNSRNL